VKTGFLKSPRINEQTKIRGKVSHKKEKQIEQSDLGKTLSDAASYHGCSL
jgi:hypothetical protein